MPKAIVTIIRETETTDYSFSTITKINTSKCVYEFKNEKDAKATLLGRGFIKSNIYSNYFYKTDVVDSDEVNYYHAFINEIKDGNAFLSFEENFENDSLWVGDF